MLVLLEQTLIFFPLVLGAYITFSLMKLPDFSIESAFLFGAVLAFCVAQLPFPAVLILAVCGGICVGIVVSVLNQLFHLPFLLAALIVNGLFHGITHFVLGTSVVSFHPPLPFSELTLLVGIGIFFLMILGWVMKSPLGFACAIYGNNVRFFKNHGISEPYVLVCATSLAYACAGISGFLFSHANGFVDLTMSFGVILLCLTALMLGKLLTNSKGPTLFIPLIGVILYFCIQQGLLRLGLNLKYFNAFQAFVVLIILLLHQKKQFHLDNLGV